MSNEFLTEAFQALDILNEEAFSVNDEGIDELRSYVSDMNDLDDSIDVIDPLATEEEEVKDSYIGKVLIKCDVCDSLIFKDPEEIIYAEDDSDLVNVEEACPYCQSNSGYEIVGEVSKYEHHCEDEECAEDSEKDVEVEADADVDVKVENTEEEEPENLEEKKDEQTDFDKIMDVLDEDLNNVEIETDDEKITVTAEPKTECECEACAEAEEQEEAPAEDSEVVAPVSDETEEKIDQANVEAEPEYQDIDFDEFDEEDFDTLGEKYLHAVYENVDSYKTTHVTTKGNELKVEGLIKFKSGKEVTTNFKFEGKSITKTGKLKFLGENKQFARGKKSFTLTGRADNNKLIAESLTYNYRAHDPEAKTSKRLYGTVVVSK